MKPIFDGISWLINKITIIISLVALLTILFTTTNIFGGLGQQLWDQFLGKDVQEIVDRLNNDINKLNDDIKELERTTVPKVKIDLEREKNNIELRIKEECETEVPLHEFYRLDKYWLKEQQKPACKALKDSQAYFLQLYENHLKRDKQLGEFKIQLGQKLIQLKDLEQKLGGVWQLLVVNFQANWTHISYIIFFVLFSPYIWKICCFRIVDTFAKKFPPIQLTNPSTDGNIIHKKAKRNLNIKVNRLNSLYVRMSYKSQCDGNLTKRTRLFWKWSAPFISYISGLFELTEFTNKSTVEDGNVVLYPKKAGDYITKIELQNHPGLIIRPAFIVGISGDIQVKTQWVWSFHSWVTGQHRYIIFYGTGNLYLEGNGGIYVTEVSPERTSVESHLLIGFDSRLGYSTICTETFWPYFRNKVSLIDNQFSGKGVFLSHTIDPKKELTPLEKNFQFISNFTSIVGKFFGF